VNVPSSPSLPHAHAQGEEIAAAALFFAMAPHFITGQILVVDGGLGL